MKQLCIFVLVLLFSFNTKAQDTYEIMYLKGTSINIAGKRLKVGDTFKGNALPEWGDDATVMKVKNLKTLKIHTLSERILKDNGVKSVHDYFLRRKKGSARDASVSNTSYVFQETSNNEFPEKRIALIIGNSNYEHLESLFTPMNDVEAISDELLKLGFDVFSAYDCTWRETRSVFKRFVEKARNYDAALFYYAGHGLQDKGKNYIIPIDADLQLRSELNFCHEIYGIIDDLESTHCSARMLFFDACRNVKSWKRSSEQNGLGAVEAPAGSVIMFSTQTNNTADDGDGIHSPFAYAFLDQIKKPHDSFEAMISNIARSTYNATNGEQFPCISGSLLKDFNFIPHGTSLTETKQRNTSQQIPTATVPSSSLTGNIDVDSVLVKVDYQISQLNFGGAIELLKTIPSSYSNYQDIEKRIKDYTFYKHEQIAGRIVSPKLAEVVSSYNVINSFHDGWARVGKYINGKLFYNFISPKGEEIHPFTTITAEQWRDFSDGMTYYSDGMNFITYIEDSLGNVKGLYPNSLKYLSTSEFKEGLLLIRDNKSEKFGFMDKMGDIVIKCKYDEAKAFSNERALVRKGDKWHFIDKKGKIVIKNIRPSLMTQFSENYAWIRFSNKDIYEYRLIDRYNIDWACSVPGYLSIKNIDVIVDYISPMFNGISLVDAHYINEQKRINFSFFVHANGTFLNDFEMFDSAFDFSEGKAVVIKDRKFAVIDKQGNKIIPYGKFNHIYSFSEGLARARSNDRKVGFINDDGETIIPFEYDAGDSFSEGFALVCKNGKWGYVDKYGFCTLTYNPSGHHE